ncbi:hypothetical protein R3P38DRAFT_2772160 [Favolaschia claudopus]|uniref:Uncharacterized protein n=1 Tax=Favolaschia claudopus TaxID=2862362 RepID=A0AAW0CBI8_9AGAR
MLLELKEVPRTRYYKPRATQAVPTMKETGAAGNSAAPTVAGPQPNTPGVIGVRFVQPAPSPPRISAITSLPGHGHIHDKSEMSSFKRMFVSGGPSLPRAAATSQTPTQAKSTGPPTTASWTSYKFQAQKDGTAPSPVPGDGAPPP